MKRGEPPSLFSRQSKAGNAFKCSHKPSQLEARFRMAQRPSSDRLSLHCGGFSPVRRSSLRLHFNASPRALFCQSEIYRCKHRACRGIGKISRKFSKIGSRQESKPASKQQPASKQHSKQQQASSSSQHSPADYQFSKTYDLSYRCLYRPCACIGKFQFAKKAV